MKRFAVFGHDTYYPGGGMSDFLRSFSTREEAEQFVKDENSKPRYSNVDMYPATSRLRTATGEWDHYEIEDMEKYE